MYPTKAPPGTLVSRLQHEHGLIKKKLHSRPPPRKPFFQDECVSPQESTSAPGHEVGATGKRAPRRKSRTSERPGNPYPSPTLSPLPAPRVGSLDHDLDRTRGPTTSPLISPLLPQSPTSFLSLAYQESNEEYFTSNKSATSSPVSVSSISLVAGGSPPLGSSFEAAAAYTNYPTPSSLHAGHTPEPAHHSQLAPHSDVHLAPYQQQQHSYVVGSITRPVPYIQESYDLYYPPSHGLLDRQTATMSQSTIPSKPVMVPPPQPPSSSAYRVQPHGQPRSYGSTSSLSGWAG